MTGSLEVDLAGKKNLPAMHRCLANVYRYGEAGIHIK
jgi:hypothetical protein